MTLIGTNFEYLVFEDKPTKRWIIHRISPGYPDQFVSQVDKPSWWEAAISKWGYAPLVQPVFVVQPNDYDASKVQESTNYVQWLPWEDSPTHDGESMPAVKKAKVKQLANHLRKKDR